MDFWHIYNGDDSQYDSGDTQADVAVAEQVEQAYAPLYAVVMHNDDYTTMDFVVYVLMEIFNHAPDRAVELMYAVHETGRAVVAILPYEIGEMRVAQVTELAEEMEYPLLTTLERQ